MKKNVESEETIRQDTISLLKECNSGIRMGISSLNDVMDKVKDQELKNILKNSRMEHEALGDQTHAILNRYEEDGKEPHPMARAMANIKTGTKLALEESDETVADLIYDGCDMGIKSLHRYLNQYPLAEEEVCEITGRIIDTEERLREGLWKYL